MSVREAQQARGWIVGQGNVVQRVRSYLPILVATIIAALRLSDNLGLALAARGSGLSRPADRVGAMIQFVRSGLAGRGPGHPALCAELVVLRFGAGYWRGRPW